MPQAQTAICQECGGYAVYLTLTVRQGGEAMARKAAAALPALTKTFAAKLDLPALVSALGVGASVWPRLFDIAAPRGLAAFSPISSGNRLAPATPADLFLHIHSPSHDANFQLARAAMELFGDSVQVVEEIHGFSHRGNRDLTGFVDGTENPTGDDRAAVALVGDDAPAFEGGSFVSIQRYVHDMRRWNALPVPDQEAAVGRTKESNEELDDDIKPPSAHIARVVIEENGEELEVVRHSLPYGTTTEAGLYFVAYCASPAPFRKMLKRMVEDDAEGNHDRLLDFTRAVTGASFFSPSIEMLESLA